MQSIIENLKALGPKRLALLGGTGLALVAGVLLGVSTLLAPNFAPLYSQLTPSTASQMVQTLEGAGIRVEMSRNGDVISVPEGDVARARMALADGGLPGEGVPGWELFDEVSGLGMNSFMQQVNRLRALEGELARSIQTIEGIEAARVHLVLPEREAFSRERPEPSASVIVRVRSGASLSRRQGQAIQALVASAVGGLEPRGITVLSATGETIMAEDEDATSDFSLMGQRAQIEERLAGKVESILNARVGAGNARVRVSVDLTTAREVHRTTSYDPNQQVARSVETRSESSNETDPQEGTVDAGNNIPDALRGPDEGGQASRNRESGSEITNYEIGSTQSETVREPGDIERVTVAVLVNGTYEEVGGETAFVPRDANEMERLAALVKTAIGFDETRGDAVEIDSFEFQGFEGDLSRPVGGGFTGFMGDNAMTILKALFVLVLTALVLVLGRQPLRMVLDAALPAPAEPVPAGGPALTDETAGTGSGTGETPRLKAPEGREQQMAARMGEVLGQSDPRGQELVQLSSVEGGVQRTQLRTVQAMAEQYPDETLRVLNSWLMER